MASSFAHKSAPVAITTGAQEFNQKYPAGKRAVGNYCQLFGRVDRTLLQRDGVVVRPVDDRSTALAFNDGTVITIGFTAPPMEHLAAGDQAAMYLLGMNYHETAHLMFSPNGKSQFRRDLLAAQNAASPHMFNAWNLLEDGRIERLMMARYPSTRPFLFAAFQAVMTATVANLVQPSWSMMYLIATVRRNYLPRKVYATCKREALAEAKFTAAEMMLAESLGDRYRKLRFGTGASNQHAMTLVTKFADLISKLTDHKSGDDQQTRSDKNKSTETMEEMENHKDAAHNDGPTDRQEQAEDNAAKERTEEDAADKADANEPEPFDSDGAPDKSDGDSGESVDGEGTGQGGDGEAGDDDAMGAGNGGTSSKDRVLDDLTESIDELAQSEAVQSELTSHRNSIKMGRGFRSTLDKFGGTVTDAMVTPAMASAAKKSALHLAKLQAQLEPGWEREQASGKLNVQRFMRQGDLDTAFDLWHEDRSDAASIEMALMGDVSDSMLWGRKHINMAQALWIVRRAVEQVGGTTHGFLFSHEPFEGWKAKDKAASNRFTVWSPDGGTNIAPLLHEAAPIFYRSKAATKVAVVFSDGDFNDDQKDLVEGVKALQAAGAIVVHFGIGFNPDNDNLFDVQMYVASATDAVQVVENIVKRSMRSKLRALVTD